MYCSSCGAAAKPGLTYCSRCGDELGAKTISGAKRAEVSPESLVWAIVAVSVGGLAILIGLLAVMKEAGFSEGLIVGFTVMSFLILLAANSAFISLLFRSKKEAAHITQAKGAGASELGAAQTGFFPEPAVNVTEHTTRTLEPANSEHKAK